MLADLKTLNNRPEKLHCVFPLSFVMFLITTTKHDVFFTFRHPALCVRITRLKISSNRHRPSPAVPLPHSLHTLLALRLLLPTVSLQ